MKMIVFCFAMLAFGSHARAGTEPATFLNIIRVPDAVEMVTETGKTNLMWNGSAFKGGGAVVEAAVTRADLTIALAASELAVKELVLRWKGTMPADGWKYLGDALERAYGDLEWRAIDGRRQMPWYFLASNGALTHGYGVVTAPAAFVNWVADPAGITLKLDLRNGTKGVLLGRRLLTVCTVVSREGKSGETSFDAAQAFCWQMCPNPRMPKEPVYGFNDWYCGYGGNSAEGTKYYTDYIVRLSPKEGPRPFMVIDMGWQATKGDLIHGKAQFPSIPELSRYIKNAGARPGIWIRVLESTKDYPQKWRHPREDKYLDPTVPEVLAHIKESVARFPQWGFELIKHDFSTWDLLGPGGRPGLRPDKQEWAFSDRTRSNAEIASKLYKTIREGAGDDVVIIGCNTYSHLSAGLFELQRIGEDTSGNNWKRTVAHGVNSLAFRGPQHGTFFAADADCVGLTGREAIPWKYNRQWMELLARSGTPLFISFKKGTLTPEQDQEVAAALAIAAKSQPLGRPLDWFETRQPRKWELMGKVVEFDWGQ